MNILALDLGTTFGFAYNRGASFEYGSLTLMKDSALRRARVLRHDRRCDPRIVNFDEWLTETQDSFESLGSSIDLVVFEDVLFAKTRAQAQLWASFRAVVWLFATHTFTTIDCLNTTALKKYATGVPSAGKDRMLKCLQKTDPVLDYARMDDNVVDAIWLWKWANERFKP